MGLAAAGGAEGMLFSVMRSFLFSLLLVAAGVADAAPAISHLSTSHGFRYAGTRVTIFGSGFTGAVQVFVGGVPALVQEVTPTSIRAIFYPSATGAPVPAGTRADVRVVVEGEGEVTARDRFTFEDAADTMENYTAYIVPFTGEIVPGANGSRWTGELTLFNGAPYEVGVIGAFDHPHVLTPPHPPYLELAPRSTKKLTLYGSGVSAGAFLYVPWPADDVVKKSLRVRDLSQNATSWGTEVPLVSHEEAQALITLIDIPTDARYRATLRIYHWSEGRYSARVKIYAPDRVEPVEQLFVQSFSPAGDSEPSRYPAYSQVDLLTPNVRAAGPAIRVEVDHVGERVSPPPPPLWAFVSVTSNDSQQVTHHARPLKRKKPPLREAS